MHKYAQLFKTCTEHESYTCIFNEHLHVCVLCMHELYIYTYMYIHIYIYIHIHISMGIYIWYGIEISLYTICIGFAYLILAGCHSRRPVGIYDCYAKRPEAEHGELGGIPILETRVFPQTKGWIPHHLEGFAGLSFQHSNIYIYIYIYTYICLCVYICVRVRVEIGGNPTKNIRMLIDASYRTQRFVIPHFLHVT